MNTRTTAAAAAAARRRRQGTREAQIKGRVHGDLSLIVAHQNGRAAVGSNVQRMDRTGCRGNLCHYVLGGDMPHDDPTAVHSC